MSLCIKHALRFLEVHLELGDRLLAHLLSELVSFSYSKGIKTHEVRLPALQKIVLLVSSHPLIEVAILTRLVCPVFRLAFFPSLSIGLGPVPLLLESVPVVVLSSSSLAKMLADVFVLELPVCILTMWLLATRFIMS